MYYMYDVPHRYMYMYNKSEVILHVHMYVIAHVCMYHMYVYTHAYHSVPFCLNKINNTRNVPHVCIFELHVH